MPSPIAYAVVPTSGGHPIVMPQSLCTAFVRSHTWPVQVNEYKDGTRQVDPLTTTSHKSWNMTKRLRVSDSSYQDLFDFWKNYPNEAFYFYDPFEVSGGAQPGSNYDATGASGVGRYKVVFKGGWQQVNNLASIEVSLQLVEVV